MRGERKELILIHITGSAVTIHDIQCNNKMEFTNKRVLPHTGVQHFSLHTHGSSPSLSFATHGNIFIYQHNGTEFYVVTLLSPPISSPLLPN